MKELRDKLLFTAMILLLFRFGCGLAVPFIDASVLAEMFRPQSAFTYLNMISGGALSQCAVFALGVTPYINASIITQLLSVVFPTWEEAQKNADGKKKLDGYTKVIALALSIVMSLGYYFILRNHGALKYTDGLAGAFTALVITLCFAAGAQLVVWLGGQIDRNGIGNGISLIIFAGIVSRWSEVYYTALDIITKVKSGKYAYVFVALAIIIAAAASVYFVVYVSGSERRIPVIYNKHVAGRKSYGGGQTYIPLRLIMSGVMPIIFANTILSIPQTVSLFISAEKQSALYNALAEFNTGKLFYCALYVILIFGFNWFYVSIQYDPVQMANDLRKNGGVIPGYRPGKATSEYISAAMRQLAGTGASILALIAIMPVIAGNLSGMPIQLGGTSLIIVVSVAEELLTALDSHITMRHRKGFLES